MVSECFSSQQKCQQKCQQRFIERVVAWLLASNPGVIGDLTKRLKTGHFTGDFAACQAMGLRLRELRLGEVLGPPTPFSVRFRPSPPSFALAGSCGASFFPCDASVRYSPSSSLCARRAGPPSSDALAAGSTSPASGPAGASSCCSCSCRPGSACTRSARCPPPPAAARLR